MSYQGGDGNSEMRMMMGMGGQESREDGSRGKKRRVTITQDLTPDVVKVMRMGNNPPGWYSINALRHAGLKLPGMADMMRHKWFTDAIASTLDHRACE